MVSFAAIGANCQNEGLRTIMIVSNHKSSPAYILYTHSNINNIYHTHSDFKIYYRLSIIYNIVIYENIYLFYHALVHKDLTEDYR